jgi:hypothetical protein
MFRAPVADGVRSVVQCEGIHPAAGGASGGDVAPPAGSDRRIGSRWLGTFGSILTAVKFIVAST